MVSMTIQQYGAAIQQQRQQLEAAEKSARESQLTFSRRQLVSSTPIQRQALKPVFQAAKTKTLSEIQTALEEQKKEEKRFEPIYRTYLEQVAQEKRIEEERSARRPKKVETKITTPPPSLSSENLEAIKRSVEKTGYLAPEIKSVLERAGYTVKVTEPSEKLLSQVQITKYGRIPTEGMGGLSLSNIKTIMADIEKKGYIEPALQEAISRQGISIQIKEAPQKQVPETISQRWIEAQRGYTLPGLGLSKLPSFTGTVGFLGGEAGRIAGKTAGKISAAYETAKGPATIGGVPIDISKYQEERKKEIESKTEEQAKYFFTGLPYMFPGTGPTLLVAGGTEAYLTPRGRETLKLQAEKIGPIAYGIPAVEIGLGALGLRQSFYESQLRALKLQKPQISIGKPVSIGENLFLTQVSETRIPYPGFRYKPKFIAGFIDKKYFSTKEPTLMGWEYISPKMQTILGAKLTPIETGGFTFFGKGRTGVSLVGITGMPKVITTQPYIVAGKVIPKELARIQTGVPGVTKLISKEPYVGGISLIPKERTARGIREYFGGFPVLETKTGKTIVVSGPIVKYSPEESLAYLEPKTLGLILPEKQVKFISGTKAQTILFPGQVSAPSISQFYKPAIIEKGQLASELIGQRVSTLGPKLIEIQKTPLVKIQVPTETTKLVQKEAQLLINVQPQIEITKTKEIQVPKTVEVSKTVLGEATVQVPKLIQTPAQIQVPKLIQITKPIQTTAIISVSRIIPIPPPIIPPIKRKSTTLPTPKKLRKLPLVIPFGRRYGKFKPIGKPTTFERAKRTGISFLKGTLGATFEVRTPKGERIPIARDLGREFRPGKKGKDIFQIVQKAPFRLGTRAERIEILAARRRIKL